jgi:hypothetical protein
MGKRTYHPLRHDPEMPAIEPTRSLIQTRVEKEIFGSLLSAAHHCSSAIAQGKANTKFFHLHTNHRRWKNYIPQILHNNEILVEQSSIEQACADHYEQLFSAPPGREFTINFEVMGVPRHDLSSLDAEFEEEEVWAAIKGMTGDRSPGPQMGSLAPF